MELRSLPAAGLPPLAKSPKSLYRRVNGNEPTADDDPLVPKESP